MKLPRPLSTSLVLLGIFLGLLVSFAPAADAGELCSEVQRARRNPANEPSQVATQGPAVASVTDDGSTAPAAPIEQSGPFDASPATSRPGPQAGSASGGAGPSSGTGLVAKARGGAISSPKQIADRQIRGVIRRLH